ncbi:MAG: phage protease, partial [Acidimicrobiales bacterium]|nr:phage protease [Acidimicrobiales bacterium]
MPLPNEHAARQRDPSLYEKLRRGELPGAPSGISAIFGVLPDGKTEIQSIRAKVDELTADAFRSWLRAHEFKAEIEEADVEAKEEEQEDLAVDVFVKKKEEEEEEEVREDLAGFWGSPCLLSSGPESWVEIVRSGTFYGATGPKPRKVELTEDDVLSMVVNHEQVTAERWFSDGAPVGYNHASSFGVMDPDSTRAAARIRKLQTRRNEHGGISLWGLFSWTPDGARRVKGGEFSSVSAELLPSGVATSKLTGKAMTGWTLVGATLTNSPFVPGMQAPSLSGTLAAAEEIHRVHLSELVKQEASRMTERTTAQQLTEILGTPEAQLLSRVQRLQEEADKVATQSEALKIATEETET